MKTQTPPPPSRRYVTVLRQVCEMIPAHLVAKLARQTGAEQRARTFSPWSHVVAMLYAQISHALGLNDVCDALRLRIGALSAIRGARPPSRNALSHANKVRPCALAEQLFWATHRHLTGRWPGFARGGPHRPLWRFRRAISLVDSTVIELVASCLDWAKHRRRKAAAKCHLRLDLHSFLPRMAVVDTGAIADATKARELCAGLRAGEIVLFDKAYVDFPHLADLHTRGVFFVSRCLERFSYRVVQRLHTTNDPRVLRDELVAPLTAHTRRNYPGPLRRVEMVVEVDGQPTVMSFLTNHLTWAATSVADLYRCRWQIEVFFKQLKQTMQVADFLGHSANAVKWQVWMALLVQLLVRFHAWQSRWGHSFTRLFTYVRAALWLDRDLAALLRHCGTADGHFRCLGQPAQAWLPGFLREPMGQHATV
jgi:hypothetical protein